jgi:hypothetical protein
VLLLWTIAARDKAHGAVTACAVRGGGVAGGRLRRCEVASGDHATAVLPRVRGTGHMAMGRRGLLASGPCHNSFSKIPKLAQTL